MKLYFISQIIDISAQKKAEQQLAETNTKMQDHLKLVPSSTIETDKGLIRTFNKGAENLTGTKEEMIGKPPALIHLESEITKREKKFDNYNFDAKGFVFTCGK
jgi:PAS domain-containing protein